MDKWMKDMSSMVRDSIIAKLESDKRINEAAVQTCNDRSELYWIYQAKIASIMGQLSELKEI